MSEELLFMVRVTAPIRDFDALEALLECAGLDHYSSWQPLDSAESTFVYYLESMSEAETLAAELGSRIRTADEFPNCTVDIESVADKDWETVWKDFFHATKVSKRVVVGPSWEDWEGDPDMLRVVIDPGMSFGTGLHPTTRACIGFIDDVADGMTDARFFDAGCGSGILSICAAKLGFGVVEGIDSDAHAVESARLNFEANGVPDVTAEHVPLEELGSVEPYDMVVVNILQPVIEANVARIRSLLRNGGNLVLAGLLHRQFDDLASEFEGLGFSLRETRKEEEWTSGLLYFS